MNIDTLREANVLITGAGGFFGQHLYDVLVEEYGCRHVLGIQGVGRERPVLFCQYDLTDPSQVEALFAEYYIDYVFHLAGYNGGIQFNLDFPADIFFRNTLMGLNLLDACRRHGVKKVVSVVASCAYGDRRGTMTEKDFLRGRPNPSVACHGYAKRNLQLASSFYRSQYGLMAVCACPTTLYGPGDSFHPTRTKVMGGMIKRFVDAVDEGKQEVTCWGTGAALREFIFVRDAARLLVETLLHYEDSDQPLNLGTGQEVSIKQLAETVARCVEFRGTINWDTSKPDGQLRKRLNLTRMKKTLPAINFTPLEQGIRQTAKCYRAMKREGKIAV